MQMNRKGKKRNKVMRKDVHEFLKDVKKERITENLKPRGQVLSCSVSEYLSRRYKIPEKKRREEI